MTTETPVYEGSRPMLKLTVWPNRVEVQTRGAFFLKQTRTIPLRNIAEVEVRNMTTLRISTNDGKHVDYAGIGAGKARDAIVGLL